MAIDNQGWHYDDTMELYCEEFGKTPDQLGSDDYSIIEARAAAHIGFFVTWLIKHDGFSTEDDSVLAFLRMVKDGDMTGTAYLLRECDGKLIDSDISEDALPFVAECYDKYLELFSQFADGRYGSSYVFLETSEDYAEVEKLIDGLYSEFLARRDA